MPQSMTGFARTSGSDETGVWYWELRSVNGKALDVRLRLPHGFEAMENKVRAMVSSNFARGNIQANLQYEPLLNEQRPVVNHDLLDQLVHLSHAVRGDHPDVAPVTMDGLLAVRGVVELQPVELSDKVIAARDDAMLKSLEEAVSQLLAARMEEGNKIASVLQDQVTQIAQLTDAVENDPSRTANSIRERLARQVGDLLAAKADLDADRLYQEAAFLATKADLREELDRLAAHVTQAQALLAEDGAIGRKLDFLSQEFNRECNTICSKSNAASVTRAGLEMKVIIDQFREQVQNIQ